LWQTPKHLFEARGLSRYGRYRLVGKLATGGMAEVFLAKAEGPGGFEKRLVLKRIRPQFAAARAGDRAGL
jgi:hypothetical protein